MGGAGRERLRRGQAHERGRRHPLAPAEALAAELRDHLARRFGIAVRILRVAAGRGFRLYQVRKPENRHVADVRRVDAMPETERVEDVLVLDPASLVAAKVVALARRRGSPKSWTDRRDLAALLLARPDLKTAAGAVRKRLEAAGAPPDALGLWEELVAEEIREEPEDGEFG